METHPRRPRRIPRSTQKPLSAFLCALCVLCELCVNPQPIQQPTASVSPNLRPFQQFLTNQPKKPRHFNKPKTKPKNPPPFQQFTTKNFSPSVAPKLPITNSQSPITNPSQSQSPSSQSEISNLKSQIAPSQIRNPQSRRRVHPILSRLTPDQKQKLILLYEQNSALDAVRLAHEKLGIQISSGTLSRLYSIWQIAEDNDTRHDLEAAHNTSIEDLTEKQLQLRLLEQASRPNMDHTELRAICQSFARLQSVKLSARRVQLAESKETRLAQNNEPERDFSPEATTRGLRVMLGRDPDDDADACDYSAENEPDQNCGSRDDEALTDSAPETSDPLVVQTSESAVSPISKSAAFQNAHDDNEKCSHLPDQSSTTPPPSSVLSASSVNNPSLSLAPSLPNLPPLAIAQTA